MIAHLVGYVFRIASIKSLNGNVRGYVVDCCLSSQQKMRSAVKKSSHERKTGCSTRATLNTFNFVSDAITSHSMPDSINDLGQ